ncbi:MAG: hypothetical protein ACXVAE_06230 [Candidatus Limnocylindrales bacterium]
MNLVTLRARAAAIAAGGLAALTLAGGVLAASPAPSGAPPASAPTARACAVEWAAAKKDPSVANLKALGDCEIERRFVTLRRLEGAVIAAPFLTEPDRQGLLEKIQATRAGLTSLKAEIDADATAGQLKVDLPKIAHDYRVYLLLAPQVNLVRGADAIGAAGGRLGQEATRLQQLIDFAKSQGKDVSAAQAALDAMTGDLAAAQAQVAGRAAKLLVLTPADWNDGSAKPVLDAARSAERSAHAELLSARKDALAVIAALR